MKRCMFIRLGHGWGFLWNVSGERKKGEGRITSHVIFFLPCTFYRQIEEGFNYQQLLAPTVAKEEWCAFEAVFEIRRKGTDVSLCDLRHREVLPPIDCLSLVPQSPRLSQQRLSPKGQLFLMRSDYQLTFLPTLLLSVSRMNQNWGEDIFYFIPVTSHSI